MSAFDRRLTAAAGILLTVFFVVALLLPGMPPKADDSTREILNFLTDKRGSLLASDFFLALGSITFLVFAGGFRRYLVAADRETEGLADAAFGGAVAGLVLIVVAAGLTNGIAFKAAGNGEPVRALFDAAGACFALAGMPFAVFLFMGGWAAARARILPAPLILLGDLAALLGLLSGIALFAKSGLFATGGAIGFIGPVVTLLWVVGVSVVLYRGAATPAATASGSA
jgi:hypothetical protein